MKSTLPPIFFFLLTFFTLYTSEVNAIPNSLSCSEPTNIITTEEGLSNITVDYPCYPPNWTYTYNISEYSATWQWESCNGANGYYIQWRYPNGSWHDVQGMCYQNWYTCNNLSPYTNYEWRVRANCGSNYYSDWCYPVYFTTLGSYCQNPSWQSCYNISSYSATWSWGACNGADYYWVQWRYQGGSWTDLYGCPMYGTWCNVNNLSPCTNYEWRVKSHCYSGWSNWCNPYGFNTMCNNCPAPSGLFTKDIGDTQATLKWSTLSGAYSYTVQIKDNWGNWYDVSGSPSSGSWITVYNLQPCHTYTWRIRANCGYYDNNGYWATNTFTTTCGHYGCGAPTWVYTSGITSTSASLHWEPVSGADYYLVEWRLAGGTWNTLQGGPWTNSWADLTGLLPKTNYEWRVKSHCHDGSTSIYSPITQFTTLGESCGLPFYRYTTPITDSTATVNWSEVAGATNYSVQFRLVNAATWADAPGSPTTATSLTLTQLLPDTLYEWRMKVNCSNGASTGWLASKSFHTGNTPGCGKPAGLYVDSISLTSAQLHWSNIEDAQTYSVEIRLLPTGPWTAVNGSPVDTNYIQVDSLIPHASYEWRVRTNCKGGFHSFYSNGYQFVTTDLPPCDAPVGLWADSITDSSAWLHWSPVAGVQGYKVQIRYPNGSWIDMGGVLSDTSFLVSSLFSHTTYEWRVYARCNDDQVSNWSVISTFTTTGTGITNDECSSATHLIVGDTCVSTFASNIDATSSLPAPAGGCSSNGNKDVWFKFTMPDVANPNVTIRTTAGSLADAVMEVYTGTDCNLVSVITCEDNNDNGNGSSMPVINLTGTSNATIWVRVWGRDGATGNFSICVFNYVSFNMAGVPSVERSDAGEPIADIPPVLQVNSDQNIQPELLVTPNPVSDQLNVSYRQTVESQVIGLKLMDYAGKEMITRKVDPSTDAHFQTKIDVSSMAPGIYVLLLQTTNGMLTEKVTVVK